MRAAKPCLVWDLGTGEGLLAPSKGDQLLKLTPSPTLLRTDKGIGWPAFTLSTACSRLWNGMLIHYSVH